MQSGLYEKSFIFVCGCGCGVVHSGWRNRECLFVGKFLIAFLFEAKVQDEKSLKLSNCDFAPTENAL